MIIIFSTKNDESNIVKKILCSKPFVWIGLISYSAYLWHFPIFSFSRINSIEPSNIYKIFLIFLTLFLSTLTYHLIEKPFRNKNFLKRNNFYFILLLSSVLIFSLALLSKQNEGFPKRFPKEGWVNFELDKNSMKKNFWKFYDDNKKTLSKPSKEKINVYIFGNSHSGDFLGALFNEISFYEEFHFLKVKKREEISCFDESDPRFRKNRDALYNHEAYKETDIFIISSRFINGQCNKSYKNNPTDADGLKYLIPRLKRDGKKIIILGNTLVLDKIEGKWLEDYVYLKALNEKSDLLSLEKFEYYKNFAEKKSYELQNNFNLETNKRLKNFFIDEWNCLFRKKKAFLQFRAKKVAMFLQKMVIV